VFAAEQAELGEIQSFDAGPARRWIWRQPGGRQAHFDAGGRLVAWRTALGQKLDLRYSPQGRLQEIRRSLQNQEGINRLMSSLELRWDAEQRLISKVLLKQFQAPNLKQVDSTDAVVAQCDYRYAGATTELAVLQFVSCSDARQPGQDWRESYQYGDARFPLALTGVQMHKAHAPPVEAIYRYDGFGRAHWSQGFGQGEDQALSIEYSPPSSAQKPWRRLSFKGQSTVFQFEAIKKDKREEASGSHDFAATGTWKRQDREACTWCPDIGSRHRARRDELGRITELRDALDDALIERRLYEHSDATALASSVLRPSIRQGHFATSRFERNAQGLVIAVKHEGFSPTLTAGGYEVIHRSLRSRYDADGSGVEAASLDDGSGASIRPDRLNLAWVIPGKQLQSLTWKGTRRLSDDFGRIALIQSPQGEWSKARYDGRDRLIEQQAHQGKVLRLRWNELSYPLEKDYGESGRAHYQWAPTPLEKSQAQAPDAPPVLHVARQEPVSEGGPAIEVSWTYDKLQRVIGRIHQIGDKRFEWRIVRDDQGRVIREKLPNGGSLHYRYDPRGLLSLTYRDGLGAKGQLLYRRVDDAVAGGGLHYRLGDFTVRWQTMAKDPSRLQSLEVEGLAKWALHPNASTDNPLSRDSQARSRGVASKHAQAESTKREREPAFASAVLSQAPGIAKAWHYDAAQRWLGDTQTRMHYDALGHPALLRSAEDRAQLMVMDGWRQMLLADQSARIQGLIVWLGSLPIAWIQSGRAYHLAVDWRGAPVLAFSSRGQVHWKADYLHPLLPAIEHREVRRKISGRSLSDRVIREKIQVNLGVPGRLFVSSQLADKDPRLKTMLFGANRVLDGQSMRFLQADPLGPAGDRDPYAYADGEPWRYIDPWGLAKLTYFAILQGETSLQVETSKPPPTTQGFSLGRWSFLLEAIAPTRAAPGAQSNPMGALQNTYAQSGQALLFDAKGSFRLSQQDPLLGDWFGEDSLRFQADHADQVMTGFRKHYGTSLITQSAFVIEDFDDAQATRLMALLSRDQQARRACLQPANYWLPPITFEDGSAMIRPDAAPGPVSAVQRLLDCDPAAGSSPAGIPAPIFLSLYANPQEQARVEKLQAAAQLQESPAPSSITPDCSKDACRSRTAIVVHGRSYFASYGASQFVIETFLRVLRQDILMAKDLDPRTLSWLGLDQQLADSSGQKQSIAWWINQGIARAQAAAQAFDALRARHGKGLSHADAMMHWNRMSATQQKQWLDSTGLDREAFVDILGFMPDSRARTEAEARNAFAAHAVFSMGRTATTSQPEIAPAPFGDWLKRLFSDQARFGLISRMLLRNHLRDILVEPALQTRISNRETPGSSAYVQRQQAIEQDIAYRVALMHNGGKKAPGALDPNRTPPAYLQAYAQEFMRVAGRGHWEALRCGQSLGVAGLQMQTLRLA